MSYIAFWREVGGNLEGGLCELGPLTDLVSCYSACCA